MWHKPPRRKYRVSDPLLRWYKRVKLPCHILWKFGTIEDNNLFSIVSQAFAKAQLLNSIFVFCSQRTQRNSGIDSLSSEGATDWFGNWSLSIQIQLFYYTFLWCAQGFDLLFIIINKFQIATTFIGFGETLLFWPQIGRRTSLGIDFLWDF